MNVIVPYCICIPSIQIKLILADRAILQQKRCKMTAAEKLNGFFRCSYQKEENRDRAPAQSKISKIWTIAWSVEVEAVEIYRTGCPSSSTCIFGINQP